MPFTGLIGASIETRAALAFPKCSPAATYGAMPAEAVIEGLVEAIGRFLLEVVLEVVFEVVCYWVGRLTLKALTLGRYPPPPDRDFLKSEIHILDWTRLT